MLIGRTGDTEIKTSEYGVGEERKTTNMKAEKISRTAFSFVFLKQKYLKKTMIISSMKFWDLTTLY